jgi:hypothetical protein
MRIRSVAVLSMLFLAALLLVPSGASARRIAVAGSLTITLAPPGTLTNQLVVTAAVVDRDALNAEETEGTVTMPLPGGIYTTPIFVNKETSGPVLADVDTLLFIVNTTDSFQFPRLTVRNLDGTVVANVELVGGIGPRATRAVRLSEVLP